MGNTKSEPLESTPTFAPTQKLVVKEEGQEDYEQALIAFNDSNIEAALLLLDKSSSVGNTKAKILLGKIYRDGIGCKADPEEAKRIFLSCTEDGLGETLIGVMYLKGLGVEKDTDEAVHYLQKAIEKDNLDAQAHLGFLHIIGKGVESNFQKGMELLNEAAEKQSPEAFAYLGLINMEGIDPEKPRNPSKAFEFFTKAVNQGHLDSHIYLSELHLQGQGTDRSPWAAAKLLLKAAEKGHARAQCYLGILYRDGIGVTAKKETAEKWLKISALQGDTLGMYSWGKYMLENPEYSDKWETTVEWLAKAARQGNTEGNEYDDIYLDGLARVFRLDENS